LGLYWSKETAESLFEEGSGDRESYSVPDKVMFPLAFIIKPEFRDIVKGMFGRRFGRDAPEFAKEQKDEVVDMWEMDKDMFKQIYSGAVAPHAPKVHE